MCGVLIFQLWRLSCSGVMPQTPCFVLGHMTHEKHACQWSDNEHGFQSHFMSGSHHTRDTLLTAITTTKPLIFKSNSTHVAHKSHTLYLLKAQTAQQPLMHMHMNFLSLLQLQINLFMPTLSFKHLRALEVVSMTACWHVRQHKQVLRTKHSVFLMWNN